MEINIFALIYFMLPAYIANMTPVIFKGVLKKLAHPVDFNKKLNGKPVFGKNKTWRGLILGSLAGIIMFLIQVSLYKFSFFQNLSIIDYTTTAVWFGLLLGFGALMGDMIESFFKRQVGIKSGKPWIPFDEIDYTVGALLFASIIYFPGWINAVIIVVISAVLHVAVNHFAFYTHIRDEKW